VPLAAAGPEARLQRLGCAQRRASGGGLPLRASALARLHHQLEARDRAHLRYALAGVGFAFSYLAVLLLRRHAL
jgi:hypothetical protein